MTVVFILSSSHDPTLLISVAKFLLYLFQYSSLAVTGKGNVYNVFYMYIYIKKYMYKKIHVYKNICNTHIHLHTHTKFNTVIIIWEYSKPTL